MVETADHKLISHFEISSQGSFMLSCHGADGLISLKYLPEGRIKELDIMMFPSYFKPEPELQIFEQLDSHRSLDSNQCVKIVRVS